MSAETCAPKTLIPTTQLLGDCRCCRYEGEWLNDDMHGAGIMKFADGSKCVDIVSVSFICGVDVVRVVQGAHCCSCVCSHLSAAACRYDGQWHTNKFQGQGKYASIVTIPRSSCPLASRVISRYVFTTGAYYFGPWSDNKMHGDGGCFVDTKGRKCSARHPCLVYLPPCVLDCTAPAPLNHP